MKVFFDRRMSVATNTSTSPSAGKPKLLLDAWKASGVPFDVAPFKPLKPSQIALAHDPKYVKGVLAGRISNGFGNRSKKIAASLPWTTGSIAAAALHALKTGETSFAGASGFHHSHYSDGGAFCTFEGNLIAAILAHEAGAKRVGIIDVDNHAGDGTEAIVRQLGLGYVKLWSFGFSDITKKNAGTWLKSFPQTVLGFEGCDLLIVNAGVDSHEFDPLGGVLTTEQMRLRDHYIFQSAKLLGVPVAVSTAGGYMRDSHGGIAPTLALHVTTFREAYEVYR